MQEEKGEGRVGWRRGEERGGRQETKRARGRDEVKRRVTERSGSSIQTNTVLFRPKVQRV